MSIKFTSATARTQCLQTALEVLRICFVILDLVTADICPAMEAAYFGSNYVFLQEN